ncbi:unnamed protein product [Cochlearia groenlandica]
MSIQGNVDWQSWIISLMCKVQRVPIKDIRVERRGLFNENTILYFYALVSLGLLQTKIPTIIFSLTMAQSAQAMACAALAAQGKGTVASTSTLRLCDTEMEQKVKKFLLTLIGRLFNPEVQRMDNQLENLPKIWKLQDKVVGKDLGVGMFQFDFTSEEELGGILFHAP